MRASSVIVLSVLVLGSPVCSRAQSPLRHWTDAVDARFARTQPVLVYTLRVDTADLTGYGVELHIRNAADTVRLGMIAHPEYDDRYSRYVENIEATGPRGATVARVDSALWLVVAPGGESTVRYRLRLPAEESSNRSAWKPFLSPTGGLVGDLHSFMYVVGQTLAPAHVILDLPPGWTIATGLTPTADPHTFFAPSAFVLADSPLLVGRLRSWAFQEQGVPHRVAYWPAPDATPFDTASLVNGLAKLTHEAVTLFGRAPYRDFTFLLQDHVEGALEHLNSVALGASSAGLASEPANFFAEAAHEYFHSWNLMRLHPAESGDVDYRTPRGSRVLWWSEGVTMYYADLMLRRAGLDAFEPTRRAHLESLIARYMMSPGSQRFSPESVSVVAYGSKPGILGDYFPSTHLQGELIGTLLDFEIRNLTGSRRSLADVLRLLSDRFSGPRGFTTLDVEHAVAEVSGSPAEARRFFERYVRQPHPLEFERYLAFAGLRVSVKWDAAVDDSGRVAADHRAYSWRSAGVAPTLLFGNPQSVWGRAGLHTGDRILSINDSLVETSAQFTQAKNRLAIGDSVRISFTRGATTRTARFLMTGYRVPTVHIEDAAGATARERQVRAAWDA
ncbi:MAG: PDZ domain-containing protein, partial [Gemmatimonadota bacterium]